jgi:hypothetical protein
MIGTIDSSGWFRSGLSGLRDSGERKGGVGLEDLLVEGRPADPFQ